jgi:hypothetical protein
MLQSSFSCSASSVGIKLGMKNFPNVVIYANLGKTSVQARDAKRANRTRSWGKVGGRQTLEA